MFVSFCLFVAVSAQRGLLPSISKDTYRKLRRYQDLSGMSNEEFENFLFEPGQGDVQIDMKYFKTF